MGAEDSSRSAGNNPPARGNAPVAELHDRSAVDVIHEYVRRTRGWARSDYRIEPKGTTADIERYWIVYVDDEKDPVAALAGARKSFAVDYDPLRHEVTKEWRFQ